MSGEPTRHHSLESSLCDRVRDGLQERIKSSPVLQAVRAAALQRAVCTPQSTKHVEVLYLKNPVDVVRWEQLQNNPDEYEVTAQESRTDPDAGPYYIVEFLSFQPK